MLGFHFVRFVLQVFPKTPRTKAAALAPSTGHADSPATIVIGRKKGSKTPKVLPRKGRKSKVMVGVVLNSFAISNKLSCKMY